MATAGRIPLLDAKTAAKICSLIRQGNHRKIAAGAAGVAPRTFRDWMKRGRDNPDALAYAVKGRAPAPRGGKAKRKAGGTRPAGRVTFGDFRRMVGEAERMAEAELVGRLARMGRKNYKAAQWMLEHRFPERWALKRLELSGPGGGPIAVGATDQLLAFLQKFDPKPEAAPDPQPAPRLIPEALPDPDVEPSSSATPAALEPSSTDAAQQLLDALGEAPDATEAPAKDPTLVEW